ncbi:hypothetical protein E2C01_027683 [Portunus trituberculatus]|uniref:Uncharacterized protein n=1 Tax=Portunus trituberculatus TaxID=210409 RepID=A0A5B7EMA5_PORTR|nr:hypothetical protein [Portunus trituberculatus]
MALTLHDAVSQVEGSCGQAMHRYCLSQSRAFCLTNPTGQQHTPCSSRLTQIFMFRFHSTDVSSQAQFY